MFNLSEQSFSTKEYATILFKEYDTLRAEVLSRSNSHHQLVAIAVTLIVGTLAFGFSKVDFQQGFFNANFYVLIVLVIGIIFAALIAARISARNTGRLGRHVATLEKRINALVGAELLTWETLHGSGTQGWVRRPEVPARD